LYLRDGRIVGTVGFAWVDSTERIGKGIWYTPENITTGHILYVSFAAIDSGRSLYEAIKILRKETKKRGVVQVCWGHHKRGTFKTRRLFKMNNCGLEALSKIKELKGVSAFTLIHLGKDNGVDLKLFKVLEKDLPLVHRPAIFHSENHFELIENGKPLPDQGWTGYVLTQKSIGRPISHKEAKTIIGGMPPVAAAVGGIVSAISGAVAATSQVIGSALFLGGAAGPLTAGQTAIATGLAGAGLGAAAGAGIGAATGVGPAKGAITGALAGGTAGTLGSTGAGLKGAAKLLATPSGGALAGATAGAITTPKEAPTSTLLKRAAIGGTLGGTIGSAAGGLAGTVSPGAAVAGAGTTKTIGEQLSGAFESRPTSGFSLSGIGDIAKAGTLASIAKEFGPKGPDKIDFDPAKEFTTLRNVLGTQGLPSATENQILKDVNTPIQELAEQFVPGASGRTVRRINEAFDLRDKQILRAFARSGQSEQNSSEVREELRRSRMDRATALSEAEQEAFTAGMTQAIQAKQFALNRSIEANQFDVNLALELADLVGTREMLQAAIEQEDENQFNTLIAQILNIGFGGQDTELARIQSNLASLRQT
jgi:hypothetical protein